jgi:hypothetical protein
MVYACRLPDEGGQASRQVTEQLGYDDAY